VQHAKDDDREQMDTRFMKTEGGGMKMKMRLGLVDCRKVTITSC
jgi:hypothetical protein